MSSRNAALNPDLHSTILVTPTIDCALTDPELELDLPENNRLYKLEQVL